jgi:hypothetical protein
MLLLFPWDSYGTRFGERRWGRWGRWGRGREVKSLDADAEMQKCRNVDAEIFIKINYFIPIPLKPYLHYVSCVVLWYNFIGL